MGYRHNQIASSKPFYNRRWFRMLVPLILLSAGGYLLLLTLSPKVTFIPVPAATSDSQDKNTDIDNANRVEIDKIGVNIPFYTGSESVLNKGAWHRFPERGDPENGGNFILSAHRFSLGWTPGQTRSRSPFYNLHRLDIGDEIKIRFDGATYNYQITKIYDVKPNAVEIESPSNEHKLTLYSCTLGGAKDGRSVIEAKQI